MTDEQEAPHRAPRIGLQLRTARLARRKTLAEVADLASITKGFLSRLERDQANASVAALMRICESLEISVADLFSDSTERVVRRGSYPAINFGGTALAEYLLTPRSEQRLQAIVSEIAPGGGSGADPYSLPADVEFAYVLAGKLVLTIRDEELLLTEGDAVTFSPTAPHSFRSASEAEVTKVLWVFSPSLPHAAHRRKQPHD